MSSSRSWSGEADEAQELLLQERLQILLERLRWSYAALWTLNPHQRVLQWKRGHYSSQVDTSKAAEKPKPGRFAQQFYTTYRSCSFTPGTGFVGRANLEGSHIWLSGDSVCQNAGSLEQSQFLSHARVKTVMCIPWLDSVLELGTTNHVGENFQLMDQIQQVLSHDLLSVPSLHDEDVAASLQQHQQQAQSTVESVLQLPDAALNQPGSSFQSPFDINMSDQVWRSDMVNFMQSDQPDSSTLPELAAAWRVVGMGENQTTRHKNNITMKASTSHGLMNLSQAGVDQYVRSRTSSFAGTSAALHAAATASSSTSVSSRGEQYSNSSSATRPGNSVSPELLHQHIMQALSPDPNVSVSISRSTPPDRTSSTARLPQPGEIHQLEAYSTIKHEQDRITGARINQSNSFNLRRTTSCGDQYEIQRALSLFEAQEFQDQWRHQHGFNPVSEAEADPYIMDAVTTHDIWKSYDGMNNSTLSNQNDMNILRKMQQSSSKILRPGQLQRRHTLAATEILKEVETHQQKAAISNMIDSSDQDFFPVQAEVSPAQAQMNNSAGNLRGRPRAASSTGSEAAAVHDTAAMNHMMAERRRRVKQKENFATLRRLVPIISKADKASTLVDAIVYLKDLQNTISEMKANEDDMVQRCEDLASKCSKLEEQNKELIAILTKDKPPGEVVRLNNQLRLHSMRSM